MAAIADAAGTTKATLYVRFPSKEAVFERVFEWALGRAAWAVPETELPDSDDLEESLAAIAEAAIRRALDPQMLAMLKIAIAYTDRFPALALHARQVYWPRQGQVADLLRRHAAMGTIVADEPEILAEHFLAMVATAPTLLASFGVSRDPVDQEDQRRVAVKLFVRGLRP